jgi:hypothetical protein
MDKKNGHAGQNVLSIPDKMSSLMPDNLSDYNIEKKEDRDNNIEKEAVGMGGGNFRLETPREIDIKEGDVVSVNKTFPQRFDVENHITKKLGPVIGELPETMDEGGWKKWLEILCRSQEEVETLINYTLFFAQSDLFRKRQDKRFDFIVDRIKERNIEVIMWRTNEGICNHGLERIWDHTNRKLMDGHFSFKGHKQFAEVLYKLIKNDGKTVI